MGLGLSDQSNHLIREKLLDAKVIYDTREKQMEKAQKLLLTKLNTSDYNGNAAVIMTPEQQRAMWTNFKSEGRFASQSRQDNSQVKALNNIKKVQSFQKMSQQPRTIGHGDLSPSTLTEYQS